MAAADKPLPMAVLGDEIAIGWDALGALLAGSQSVRKTYECTQTICGIAASEDAYYLPIALCHETEVRLRVGYGPYGEGEFVVAQKAQTPMAVYTGNDTLVIIGQHQGGVYRVSRKEGVRWHLPFSWPHAAPLALVSAGPQEFATVEQDGSVTVFSIRGC